MKIVALLVTMAMASVSFAEHHETKAADKAAPATAPAAGAQEMGHDKAASEMGHDKMAPAADAKADHKKASKKKH